jgi:hypothetical protein
MRSQTLLTAAIVTACNAEPTTSPPVPDNETAGPARRASWHSVPLLRTVPLGDGNDFYASMDLGECQLESVDGVDSVTHHGECLMAFRMGLYFGAGMSNRSRRYPTRPFVGAVSGQSVEWIGWREPNGWSGLEVQIPIEQLVEPPYVPDVFDAHLPAVLHAWVLAPTEAAAEIGTYRFATLDFYSVYPERLPRLPSP